MKNLKLKIACLMFLLSFSQLSNAAGWHTAKILKIKLEGAEILMVELDQTIQEPGCANANVIFRDTELPGSSLEMKRDMMNKLYSTMMSAFYTDTAVVFGVDGCEGVSPLVSRGIHLAK